MGSRARTAARTDDAPADSLPPTADSFWGEDSGSLQAPMQAPADAWRGHWEPASADSARPTSARHRVSILRLRLPSLPRRGFGFGFGFGRGSAAAILSVLAACVVVVLAVIGQTEGGTRNAGKTTAASSKSARIVTAAGANLARLRATPVVTQITGEPASHHAAKTATGAARSHARWHRAHASTLRHRDRRPAPRPTRSMSHPVHTTTPNPTPAPATTPTTRAPASSGTSSSPPASTDRSTTSSTQRQSAFGASGSLGPGSSPDS
jgi:hypothetical protein